MTKETSNEARDAAGDSWRYFLYRPTETRLAKSKKFPAILWLHGRSLRGNDLDQLRRYGPPSFLAKKDDFPFFVLCPQLTDGAWPADPLQDFLEECLDRYPIDPGRVILTGDSLGAMGAWNLAGHYAGSFAALSPITAHGPAWVAENVIDLPIRAWHGDSDEAVPMTEHVALIERIQALGGDARLKVIAGGTHSSVIGMNWRDSEWLQWIEEQSRTRDE